MGLWGLRVTALGIACLWTAAAAHAQSATPAAKVNAEGNVTQLTGPLRFNPATVTVGVGDQVEWVNTDILVPHTATEDHGLWNLTGTYGMTRLTPPWLLHPNEILDGALSGPYRTMFATSWIQPVSSGRGT